MKTFITSFWLLTLVLLVACQANTPHNGAQKNPTGKDAKQTARVTGHGISDAHRQAYIAELDEDGDARVTQAEMEAFRKSRFDDADVNRNGLIDEDEYVDEYAARLEQQISGERAAHLEQTVTRFKSLDKDKNGVISWDEYKASGDRAFAHFDKQSTGTVTTVGDKKSARRSRSVLAMPSSHSIQGFLELYDEDTDGTVTRAEFDRHRQQAFAATDIDSSGDLSAGEYHIEFETRLDRQADRVREAQIKQAYVRFGVLDKNKDEAIDWNEYLTIGLRGFERWDLDKNGVVDSRDPLPASRVARKEEAKPAGKKSSDDAY